MPVTAAVALARIEKPQTYVVLVPENVNVAVVAPVVPVADAVSGVDPNGYRLPGVAVVDIGVMPAPPWTVTARVEGVPSAVASVVDSVTGEEAASAAAPLALVFVTKALTPGTNTAPGLEP